MTAVSKPSVPAKAAASAALTPEQTEQLTRAQACLRLEEYIHTQQPIFARRRGEEEEKLFKDLAAIPEFTGNNRVADRLKTYAAATAAIDAEETQLKGLGRLVRARIKLFTEEQCNLLRLTLEQRLKVLSETHSREQKEADAVEAEIKAVKKRLDEIGTFKSAAKTSAKAR